jgi:hypothetical protein
LDIGEGHGPDPVRGAGQAGDLRQGQTQPLFEEPEEVLDAETQQIHLAQIDQGHGGRPTPEQPQGPLILGLAVGGQELNADDTAHQSRQGLEVQLAPSTHAHAG